MVHGNLAPCLDRMKEAYDALRAKGEDLFVYGTESEFIIPLSVNEKGRSTNSEGNIEITDADVQLMRSRGYSDLFIDNISKGRVKIRQYTEIGSLHNFDLGVLERALEGKITRVYELDLDIH